jgi:hypothetical protein
MENTSPKPWYLRKKFIALWVVIALGIIGSITSPDESTTKASSSVEIIDVQNCSATDSTEGWYWGACFKGKDIEPDTKLDCSVDALDMDGKAILSDSFEAVSLNDGQIIKYGEAGFLDTTEANVKAISSFDISCNKK